MTVALEHPEKIAGPYDKHTSPGVAGSEQLPLHLNPNRPFASNGMLRGLARMF